MMVHDDDGGVLGLATHARDEALVEVRTAGADACLGRRLRLAPYRRVLGEIGELGAIAGLRRERPPLEPRERDAARAASSGGSQLLEAPLAEVVREPLHERRFEGDPVRREHLGDERQILGEDLLLQGLGRSRDDDLLAAQDGRDEVRQRLARTGPCLDEEGAVARERRLHRLGHRHLRRALFVAVERAAERRARTENVVRAQLHAAHSTCSRSRRRR